MARCNLDFKRRREDLLVAQEEEKLERDASQRAVDQKAESQYNDVSDGLRAQLNTLESQNQTLQADIKRMATEKGSQIAALQQEVHQLQQDLRRKREQNTTKIQNLSQEWDRRTATLTSDMTKQYKVLLDSWEEKFQESKESFQTRQEGAAAHHSRMMKKSQDHWKQQLDHATECGLVQCNDVKEEGAKRLAVKEAERTSLREALQKVALQDTPLRDLAYRISTNEDVLQKVVNSRRVSEAARRMAEIALQFVAMYNENRPEPSQLQNLIRATSHGTRCTIAPVPGGSRRRGNSCKESSSTISSPALSTKPSSVPSLRFGGAASTTATTPAAADRYVPTKLWCTRHQHVDSTAPGATKRTL